MNTQHDSIEVVGVRPYARLLTMLGEQLIKNDQIALVELLKNSYDADALKVAVDFSSFTTDLRSRLSSRISLTDNGEGMTEATVREHWLNPATPGKRDRKRINPRTPSGRVMQGEKGIGRFAIFKLGSVARIITRAVDSENELVIDYDLQFLDEANPAKSDNPTFLDEIKVTLTTRDPEVFDGNSQKGLGALHGTRIEISSLRSEWGEQAVERAYREAARLRPLIPKTQVSQSLVVSTETAFDIQFLRDGGELNYREDLDRQLKSLFDERAVLKVDGYYSADDSGFVLEINGHTSVLPLTDPSVTALRVFRRHFTEATPPRDVSSIESGSFSFSFFVFDLAANAPVEHHLDKDQKRLVKEHRIYLYRDGVRVLPYGDPEDDWLQLDIIRGTSGANRILGNDQTVGFVYITQNDNPNLQDKTNREGLLSSGYALADFVVLLQTILEYIRRTDFQRYATRNEINRLNANYAKNAVSNNFETILADSTLTPRTRAELSSLQSKYHSERTFLETRASRTEDLAGVGLSVEAASHDIIATANQALRYARSVSAMIGDDPGAAPELVTESGALIESLAFVTSRLQDIQGLFVSTRQTKRLVLLQDYVDRVRKIYSGLIRHFNVRVTVVEHGDQLRVKATDAALLQVLINLFDNALFWLNTTKTENPQILITLDETRKRMIFSDNGPGITVADAPYIFEAFYSGKGDAGKGLGLYIARQVGLRSGFTVDLMLEESASPLRGANFIVDFAPEPGDD